MFHFSIRRIRLSPVGYGNLSNIFLRIQQLLYYGIDFCILLRPAADQHHVTILIYMYKHANKKADEFIENHFLSLPFFSSRNPEYTYGICTYIFCFTLFGSLNVTLKVDHFIQRSGDVDSFENLDIQHHGQKWRSKQFSETLITLQSISMGTIMVFFFFFYDFCWCLGSFSDRVTPHSARDLSTITDLQWFTMTNSVCTEFSFLECTPYTLESPIH